MRRIAAFVFAAHFLMVAALIFQHWLSYRAKPMHPIVVRTRQLQPEILIAKQSSTVKQTSPPPKVVAPRPTATSTAKKSTSPAKQITSTKKTSASTRPETVPTYAPTESKRESLYVPEIREVATYSEPEDPHSSYAGYLVSYLQSSLELPEYGTVRTKLTIDRYGRLIECEILDTQSKANGAFLKEKIQDLTLPVFSDFGIMDLTQTFTISFRNVEIHDTGCRK